MGNSFDECSFATKKASEYKLMLGNDFSKDHKEMIRVSIIRYEKMKKNYCK